MKIKTISGISFALAFCCILLLFFEINIQYISRTHLIVALFAFGFIGFGLNLFNVNESPHSATYTIVYWLANIFILIGLTFKLMHWPFASILLLVGCALLGFSFLLPKKRTQKAEAPDDVIDNF